MTIYWTMFGIVAFAALIPKRLPTGQARVAWMAVGILFVALIGLRHEVGGDWFNYERQFFNVSAWNFSEAILETKDPGYFGLGWVLAQFGFDIYALNLVCALLLVVGVFKFARQQQYCWAVLVAAVPYLLIVVGMGYTRQAAAIGLSMIGLSALANGGVKRFVFWILVAAAFHKSAVLLLPIAALAGAKNRLWISIWLSVVALVAGWVFIFDSSQQLWQNYVQDDYAQASEGGAVRVWMNAIAAVIILILSRRIFSNYKEDRLWHWMSILALVCIPLIPVSITAVDRIALYFIPIQLVVAGRLPAVARTSHGRGLLMLGIVFYYGAVQFVWLNFASHVDAWLPYQFMPFLVGT